MAEIKETGYGGASITLSSGLEIRFPGINPAGRGPIIEDIRNVVTALFAAVKDLDDRLAKLERNRRGAFFTVLVSARDSASDMKTVFEAGVKYGTRPRL